MAVAFFSFQLAPDVRHVSPSSGWGGWFEQEAVPLFGLGIRDFHLHNPFGLYIISGRLKPDGDWLKMHIDQYYLAKRDHYDWLANDDDLRRAVQLVHDHGGKVRAYVGSPLVIPTLATPLLQRGTWPVQPESLVTACRALLWLCRRWLKFGQFYFQMWRRLVMSQIEVLLNAQVDAIAFDHSNDFDHAHCMYQLVVDLLARSRPTEVMLEAWPLKGRLYPPVNWILRESWYQHIQSGASGTDQWAQLRDVPGQIYRIVVQDPHDLSDGGYANAQEAVNRIRHDGHIPVVAYNLLVSGDVV